MPKERLKDRVEGHQRIREAKGGVEVEEYRDRGRSRRVGREG